MKKTEAKLRDAVKKLLAEGKVDVVIGYEAGTLPLCTRPCFVREANAVDALVWNEHCSNNLAVYLPGLFERPARMKGEYEPPKVGIVAKGCDVRSVVGLLKERQVPRENLVIIGVPCVGMKSPGEDKIQEACEECTDAAATGADVTIEGDAKQAAVTRYEKVKEFEGKSREERWQYFVDEISKCIRCYACRQACPNCYCKSCFADQTKPRWIGAGDELSDLMAFHIGRIFHQAGRCVECDACVRACPMGIDLRPFTTKLGKDVLELFNYIPGSSVDDPLPLCTFTEKDSEEFITEP